MKAQFFDLDINVKHREFETELFGKRDGFPFAIGRMPH